MSSKMPVKNILRKLLRENNITPYAFWKALDVGQNTAYRLCGDPNSVPSKKIMDKILAVYQWLPGDYLVSEEHWNQWVESLPLEERNEILNSVQSYARRTKNGSLKQSNSTKFIDFPDFAA